MQYTLKTKDDFTVSKWSGGATWELLLCPATGSYQKREFDLRISSASVELAESNFTALAGFERWICPLTGKLELWHQTGSEDREQNLTLLPYQIHHFRGDWPTHSQGKVQDFNVIYREGRQVELVSLAAGEAWQSSKSQLAIFSYEGSKVQLASELITLPAFSLVFLENIASGKELKALAGGRILVVNWD